MVKYFVDWILRSKSNHGNRREVLCSTYVQNDRIHQQSMNPIQRGTSYPGRKP